MNTLARFPLPVVVKADGLAAGKGVVVARSHQEARKAVEDFMLRKTLGDAGDRVVIEECLAGEEASFIVLTDGRGILPLSRPRTTRLCSMGTRAPTRGAWVHTALTRFSANRCTMKFFAPSSRPRWQAWKWKALPTAAFCIAG